MARQARRDGDRAHAGAVGHRGSGRLVGRRVAGERRAADGVSRAASTSCTTRSASRRRSKSATRVLKARGTLVKAGVHGPTWWEDTPLYFKEISMVGSNAFGFETVDGVSSTASSTTSIWSATGRVDLTGMLTHTYALDDWRDAFTTIATQGDTGAIKVAFDFRERMAMSDDVVLVDIADRVAVITLNRPDQRNALEPGGPQAAPAGDHRARRRRRRRRDDPHRCRSRVLGRRRPEGVRLRAGDRGETDTADMGSRDDDGRCRSAARCRRARSRSSARSTASRSPAASRSRSAATSWSRPNAPASPTPTRASA